MEAVATLSLACSVVQLVDFSLKATDTCRELYKAGSTRNHKAIESQATELRKLCASVESTLQQASGGTTLSQDSQNLQQCATRCTDAAAELEDAFSKLRINPGKKRDALGKTIKTIWKADELEKLQQRLKTEQDLLEGQLLLNLRYVRRMADSDPEILTALPEIWLLLRSCRRA